MRHHLPAPAPSMLALGLVAVTTSAGLAGCADSLPDSEPSTDQSATAGEEGGDLGNKGDIYGDDDRREYFETESETLRKVGRASAVLLDADDVSSTDDGAAQLPDKTLAEDLPACPSAKFSDQPAPGNCSAFLVAPDVIVSAGHCIDDQQECESTRAVFGFRYEESTEEAAASVSEEDVYSCEEVVARDYDSDQDLDHGVYRLDRPVEGVEPLEFRTDGKVPSDTRLAVVGHPMGLPLKITAGGKIIDNEPGPWFLYNLDAFGGHSGAAVVDVETGVVEGIHVRGAPDYVRTSHDGEYCKKMRTCEEVDPENDNCSGTEGTRATQFAPDVPTATTGSNGTESCCSVCTENQQACGDECIAASATCEVPYGCACEEPSDE